MSRTYRWWTKAKSHCKLLNKSWFTWYREINPFYSKHENKLKRVEQHRQLRHDNKERIRRGRDVEKEQKTQGWETH